MTSILEGLKQRVDKDLNYTFLMASISQYIFFLLEREYRLEVFKDIKPDSIVCNIYNDDDTLELQFTAANVVEVESQLEDFYTTL